MGIGVSIFLLASGAILSFGVEEQPSGVNLDTIGIILMLIGGLGLLLSLLLFDDWRPWGRDRVAYDDRRVYDTDRVTYERALPEEVVESEPLPRRPVGTEPLVRRRVTSFRVYR